MKNTTQTTTNGSTVEKIQTSQKVGDTAVQKETVIASEQVDSRELTIAKTNQIIWLGVHVVGVVIALRFFFLLFGASLQGFALIVYDASIILVRPFQGIFPAPSAGGSYFDSAALLALVIWYLLGYLVTYAITILSNRTNSEVVTS